MFGMKACGMVNFGRINFKDVWGIAAWRGSLESQKAESEVQGEARSGDGNMSLTCMCEQTRSLRERSEK